MITEAFGSLPPKRKTKRTWRYWLRLLTFFACSLTAAVLGFPYLLGAVTVLSLLYAPCLGNGPDPADYGYAREEIVIQASAGGSFRAYFVPGSNGATIIMPPPLSSGRGGRWAETMLLLRHGYTVLTFESRRCAGMGPLSLGYREVDEVGDALAYLQTRAEVDSARIGVYGFSSAGATSIMSAARFPALNAVVAEGGYGDFAGDSLGTPQQAGLIGHFEQGYIWAFRPIYRAVVGLDIEILSPVSVIDDIAPRPILLIYGSQEVSLPGARRQQAAAGDNAELWIVAGAGHGNYLSVAPQEYEARLIGFFDQALLHSN